ncbi:MAG: DUF6783 domain-containing protein [Ruminococcus sp.]
MKNHSRNLHAPLCDYLTPVAVARHSPIRAKSPTNCDAHLGRKPFSNTL